MIKLQRILIPTDFSDYSKVAVRYAHALAERFGAELHLLYVLQDLVALVPEPGLAFAPQGDYMAELRTSAEKGLAELIQSEKLQDVTVVPKTTEGTPFVEIIRYSKDNEIDLIVMGTHGRTGLTHALLGSVTEKVVRKSPCPVLTVRPDEHQFVSP